MRAGGSARSESSSRPASSALLSVRLACRPARWLTEVEWDRRRGGGSRGAAGRVPSRRNHRDAVTVFRLGSLSDAPLLFVLNKLDDLTQDLTVSQLSDVADYLEDVAYT